MRLHLRFKNFIGGQGRKGSAAKKVKKYLASLSPPFTFIFKKDFIYSFVENREGREKEKDRNINVWLSLMHPLLGTRPATQACVLSGHRTNDPLVHRPALNPLSHTSQGYASCFKSPF